MDLRGFVKNLTLSEVACAAGLAVLSAGAGYCLYRGLRRGSAPPAHIQPSHEPVDEQEESLDTPSVLQVIEPNLQLLPTEPHREPSAFILTLSAGELDSACCSVQVPCADSCSSQAVVEPADVLEELLDTPSVLQVLESNLQLQPTEPHHEPSAVILPLSAGELDSACCSVQFPLADFCSSQSVVEPVDVLEDLLDTPSVLQVIEQNLQLLPAEPHHEPSAVVPHLSAGELDSACYSVQLTTSNFFGSESGSVNIKGCFLGMIRGPERLFWWLKTIKTRYTNHVGFPYHTRTEDWFTGIRLVSGTVAEFFSCNRLETAINVPREEYVHTFIEVTRTYVLVGPDGQEHSDTWTEENSHCTFFNDAESQPDSEECEESLTPEEMEVPFLSSHLADRGVSDIALKLCALRQAFSTVLASIHNMNFFFVVGKKIAMRLAAANNQDVAGVQLAYESLIRFLRRPSNKYSIEAELSGAQLHHYNFLDVFCELLLFGYFKNGSVPEAFQGGFLERLFALIDLWDVDVWEPAAEQYFTVLIDKLTVLSEVLFSLPTEHYSDPAALASTVLHLLWQHLATLERL